MTEITLELAGNAAKSAHEIATLQHVLPFDVANCAVMIGLEILRSKQDHQEGLMQKFIRSQQPVTLPPAQDNPAREIQEAKKRLILDGLGIWKELATTPRDGLQYPHEVRSEWNEFYSTPTSSSTSSMRLQFLRSTNGSNRCIHRR